MRSLFLAAMVLLISFSFDLANAWDFATIAAPSPANSTIPRFIPIVTSRNGSPDPAGIVTAIIRDIANNPVPGQTVTLDFSGCTHVQPAAEQSFTGMTVTCAPPVLSAVTNAAGQVSFLVMGSVVDRSDPATNLGCISMYAGTPPVFMGTVSPVADDQDGVSGLTANDLALVACDVATAGLGGPYKARSDFSGDGSINALDMAIWLQHHFDDFQDLGTGTRTPIRCDGGATTTPENVVPGGVLRLNWFDCAGSGVVAKTRTFSCTSNSGNSDLVASFIAPAGVDALTGFEAKVTVVNDEGQALPAWWRLDSAGCRSASFSLIGNSALGSCSVAGGDLVAAGRVDYLSLGPTTTELTIRGIGTSGAAGIPLNPGDEYEVFRLHLNHSLTTGTGACVGCLKKVALVFNELRLRQPTTNGDCGSIVAAGGDFIIVPPNANDGCFAFWQGEPAGFRTRLGVPTPHAPASVQLTCTNPSRGTGRVDLVVPRAMLCTLALFDVAGRRRRMLLNETVSAGARTLAWDGRDDAGQSLASGYYVLRLITDAGVVSRPLVHLN